MKTGDTARRHERAAFVGVLALAALLFTGCPHDSSTVSRSPLLEVTAEGNTRTAMLVGQEVGGETRPSLELRPGSRLRLRADAAGRVRFATATPGEWAAGAEILLSVERGPAGGKGVELRPGAGARWQSFEETLVVAPGDTLTLALKGAEHPVWIANPRVEQSVEPSSVALVVVILIDTLRADHTSLDGYTHATSPHLERLAADGTAFLRAYAPSSWTRPSTASLLTSLGPERHRAIGRFDLLGEEIVTWPEVAQEAGFRTVGISTNPNVLPIWGFAQGFARFVDLDSREWLNRSSRADDVFQSGIELLDEEQSPVFLYLHVMDPHHPYEPPIEAAQALYPDFSPDEPGARPRKRASAEVIASAVRRYDGEIRSTDAALGRFCDALNERGLYDDAVIVVVGDHGEEFHDHGGLYHSTSLYEEQLRVPMVIKLPGRGAGGRRISTLASIQDALPTVADALGWELPSGIQGQSLRPAIEYGRPTRDHIAASLQVDRIHAYALITDTHKLIRHLTPRPVTMFFDLEHDPGETQPQEESSAKRRLEAELDRTLAEDQAGWHLRICGGQSSRRLELSVEGVSVPPRELGLEPGDSLRRVGNRLQMVMIAGPAHRAREQRGKHVEVRVIDEDEIVFTSTRSWISLRSSAPLPALVVGEEAATWDRARNIDARDAERAASNPPLCTVAANPSVLLWYVAEQPVAAAVEPSAELRARLRELGYLRDESD